MMETARRSDASRLLPAGARKDSNMSQRAESIRELDWLRARATSGERRAASPPAAHTGGAMTPRKRRHA